MHKFTVVILLFLSFFRLSAQSNAETTALLDRWRAEMRHLGALVIVKRCDSLAEFRTGAERAAVLTLGATGNRNLGNHAESLRNHKEALALRKKAFGQNSKRTASSLMNIGNVYRVMGKYEEAGASYDESYSIYKKVHKGEPEKLLKIQSNLGSFYTETNKFGKAKDILKEAIFNTSKDETGLIKPYIGLGNVFFQESKYDSASFYYKEALDLTKSKETSQQRADILVNLANCYSKYGYGHKALMHLKEAKKISAQLFDNLPFFLGNLNLAFGNAYFDFNDFRLAEEYYLAAIASYPSESKFQADAMVALGQVLRFQGKSHQARDVFSDAITLYDDQPNGVDQKRLAQAFLSLGDSYMDVEHYEPAANYYAQAEALLDSRKNDLAKRCYLKLAEAKRKARRLGDAELALATLKNTALSPRLSYTYWYIYANILADKSELKKAKVAFEKAWTALNKDESLFPYEALQIRLANVKLLAAESVGQADSYWENTLLAVDSLLDFMEKGGVGGQSIEVKFNYQRLFFEVYDIAVEAAMQLGNEERAFLYSERSKNTFLKRQRERMQMNAAQVDLQKRLVWLQQKRFEQSELPIVFQEKKVLADIDEKIGEIRNALKEYEYTVDTIITKYDFKKIQSALDLDESFLSIYVGKDWFLSFCINQDTVSVHQVAVDDSFLKQVVEYYGFCRKHPELYPEKEKERIFAAFAEQNYFLYQKIIAPIKDQLRPKVSVVLDGWLHYVPFEALIDSPVEAPFYRFRDYPFLIKKHSFRYAYSAEHAFLPKKNIESEKGLLAFAPKFEEDPRGLEALENNATEVQAIIENWGGTAMENTAARESVFKSTCQDASILLLATHGKVNDQNPDYGFVAFTYDAQDSVEDNTLYASEIALLDLKTQLLVLSACETADGHLGRGEGLMSLAYAFQLAGAESVVASLWNVDDRQMPIIMDYFFEALSLTDKPIALRSARTVFMENGTHEDAHPFYWAGLRLMGADGKVLLNSAERTLWFWFIGFSMIGLILLLLIKFNQRRRMS